MSTSKAQLFPHNSRVCAVLLLAFLRSISAETPIGKSSSRLRAAVIQGNPNLTIVIPADANGCVPCSPSSGYPLPLCVCIASKTLCGDVETTCDELNSTAASSTPHDSSHVGHLDPALQGGDAVDATSRRTCYNPSCLQLNCYQREQHYPNPPVLNPGFCPLLVLTWAGSPSPFVNHIPADPFCGPGAYLQCARALPKPTSEKYPDPLENMVESGGDKVTGALSDAWPLAGWWCKTHPFWAIVSAVLWVPVLLVGSAMTVVASVFALYGLFLPLYGLYCLFVFLYSAGLEFIEDMPLIAVAVTSIVSVLIATRWARARYRKATSLPRTE